jgi:hypothetical protein
MVLFSSCGSKVADGNKAPLLEVEGKFLYYEDIQQVIPPNVNKVDSAQIAKSYIRKWVTDVLLYENAKRNITNKSEIDELVENYRKSLTIHQYQQKMIEQRLPKEPSDEELKAFYDKYSSQLLLKENVIKGLLLVVPAKAPQIANVRSWVQSANVKALGSIEKYSIQNAISYDYFGDKWVPFSDVLKKMPIKVENPTSYISSNRFVEVSDSTHRYFLRIIGYKNTGSVEPLEMSRDRIINILLNKMKGEFISKFENDLYDDAIKDENVTFFKRKK